MPFLEALLFSGKDLRAGAECEAALVKNFSKRRVTFPQVNAHIECPCR